MEKCALKNGQRITEINVEQALGFKASQLEWTLVCLAYNLKRLHILGATPKPA
jgi:hypothetical protein